MEPERRLFPEDASRSEVEALENRFDRQLGPHTRRYAYFYLLKEPELCQRLMRQKGPEREQQLLPWGWPALSQLMRQSMRITPEASQRSLQTLLAEFDFVDQQLADGRPYLCGECFTAADLCFAALGAL